MTGMNREVKKKIAAMGIVSAVLFFLFAVLTVLLRTVDVQAIGAGGTEIGLATLNGAARDFLVYRSVLYTVTGLTGYMAFLAPVCFLGLGGYQLVRRRSLRLVDGDLYLLAAVYVLLGAFYVLFEKAVINYRPILLGAEPEPSFPSSHAMLAVVLLGTAMAEIAVRIRVKWLLAAGESFLGVLLAVTVLGRLFSGVHWLTDILGGLLLGGALLTAFLAGFFLVRARQTSSCKKQSVRV